MMTGVIFRENAVRREACKAGVVVKRENWGLRAGRCAPAGRLLAGLFFAFALMFLPGAPYSALARGWSTTGADGVKWLVTPSGQDFFSLGVNNVAGGSAEDKAKGQHAYFWERFYPSLAAWGQDTQTRLES